MALNVLPLLDNIISYINILTKDIIIKYTTKANEDETLEYRKSFDYYWLAYTKQDKFTTYPNFCEEALRYAGVNVEEELEACLKDKENIPYYLRDKVVETQRYVVVRDFEEQNEYYRKYTGLPRKDDKEYIYVDEYYADLFDIDPSIPLHKLSDVDISLLAGAGYINELIKQYPEKEYLNFLGVSRLDLYHLRHMNNLSIIHIKKNAVPNKLFEEFMTVYEQSREYFMNAVYIKEYAIMHEYYENVIAFVVMLNAIKMLMTRIFKNGIDRDFYDLPSIIKMFDAYNIPYIKEFNIEQQRTILRNINNLIRIKSTDKVLIEICSLLGFGDIDMYRYYLIKKHKRDFETGNPLFVYKENPLTKQKVLDKEKMYKVNFCRVNVKETNIGLALTKTENHLPYNEVVDLDPYWYEDKELVKILYDTEYNFMETKYLSFELIVKMSKVIFEQIYFLSMLHDKKDEMRNIWVTFPDLDASIEITLFDTAVLIFALTCKKNKIKGKIVYEPTQIGNLLGFNFFNDMKPVIEAIKNDPKLYDQELIDFVTNMNVSDINDVNHLYKNIISFRNYIEEKMFECKDKETYFKYRSIYKIFMTTGCMESLFKLPDGTSAETYMEYLQFTNLKVYNIIKDMDNDKINDLISHIIAKLIEYCDELKYLHLTTGSIPKTINAIWVLINFFKSYTVDVQQFNVVYLFDGKIENMIKLTEEVSVEVDVNIAEETDGPLLYDTLSMHSNLQVDTEYKMNSKIQTHTNMTLDNDRITMEDTALIKSDVDLYDELSLYDSAIIHVDLTPIDKITMEDVYRCYTTGYLESDHIKQNDKMVIRYQTIAYDQLPLYDKIHLIQNIRLNDQLELQDKLSIHSAPIAKDTLTFEHQLESKANMDVDHNMTLIEDALIHTEYIHKDQIKFRDTYKIIREK